MDIEGIIHIWNLPKTKVYIDLNKDFKEQILNNLYSIEPKKRVLERKLNEGEHSIDNFRNGTKNLAFLLKIQKFLEKNGKSVSLRKIERNIILMRTCQTQNIDKSTIYNPKLPINFRTKDASKLLMGLYCDGWIAKELRIGYSNNDLELKKDVYNSTSKIFGPITTTISKKEFKLPKICGYFIREIIDFSPGNKTDSNPKFPEFLVNSNNKEVLNYALRQAFDDEGSIIYSKEKHDRRVVIKLSVDVTNIEKKERVEILKNNSMEYAPNLIKDIRKMLLNLGIESRIKVINGEYITKKSKIRHKWILKISGRKNLENFYKEVGFSIKRKEGKLKKAIEDYEREQYRQKENMKITLNAAKRLENEGKDITAKSISKKINRTEGHSKELLNNLVFLKFLKIKKGCILINGRLQSTIYEVNK